MGGKSSKAVARTITKPIKNYNVENRAQKAVQEHKVKPKVAPYYPSTAEHIEKTISDTPEVRDELEKKDTQTIERMGKLFIEQTGEKPDLRKKELPQNRNKSDPYLEMERASSVPKGKLSLLNVRQILENYKTDPKSETVRKVSKDYNLDLSTAGHLVKFYRIVDFGDENLTDKFESKLKEQFIQLSKMTKTEKSEPIDTKDSRFSSVKPEVDGKS